jgi:hypothetical protein
MSDELSPKPLLNPEITSFFSSARASLAKATEGGGGVNLGAIVLVILLIAVAIGLFVWLYRKMRVFESPANVARLSRDATKAQLIYAQENPKRIGLRDYLKTLQAANVGANLMPLTNFYVSTVNATGVFFPAADGTISAEAARAAVLGGARAFVFDIWPDMKAGANFGPVIQTVESGSMWRRISLNSLPFVSVLQALTREAFQSGRPGSEDPIFLYLRFRGKPRRSTYDGAAAALRTTLERYRLDPSYNGARGQDRLFASPITNFFNKALIFSNTLAEGSMLNDYINVGPKDGVPLEYGVKDPKGMNSIMKADAIKRIKQNLSWMAPPSEDPEAEANAYDWSAAHDLGIHFVAMNFWNRNDAFKKYMAPTLFGKQSFNLKPANLRYLLELIPDPKYPVDPKWGTGAKAGDLKEPPAIRMP